MLIGCGSWPRPCQTRPHLFVDHLLKLGLVDRLLAMPLQLLAERVAGVFEVTLLRAVLLLQLLQLALQLLLVHRQRLDLTLQDLEADCSVG